MFFGSDRSSKKANVRQSASSYLWSTDTEALNLFLSYFRVSNSTFLSVQGSGPISSAVLGLAGYRLTCMLGSLLATFAFLLTSLMMELGVTSILPYYPVTGAMAGLGLGLLYMVARAVVNEWFDKRMGLATGLASAGSGVGQLVMAPLLVTAMDSLGLPPTFIILGSVTGAGILLGLALDIPEKTRSKIYQVRYIIHQFC